MKYKETIEWNEIKFRTMADDEIEELAQNLGCDVDDIGNEAFDCLLPSPDEEVLLKTNYGISISYFAEDDYGVYFEDFDSNDVIAWAHLPTGVKPKEENEQ